MEIITKTFETPNGSAEGVCVKWSGFSILMVTGTKGFLACPAIDVDACRLYGKAAAVIESSADNPIGTLERFCERKITRANQNARSLGVKEGMFAKDAFALIA
ncbi:MAG: hypothetical protein DRP65_03745 [Planctomycetota bacterium]|nr:MAG: hypothetical protein DRP65_03745 [Planctomycetota bacterium]